MGGVAISNVSKTYPGGARALRDVSLQVEDQTFLSLVGPSGCGKSTLLRVIAGLETPDSGSVHFGRRDMAGVAARDRDVAMVFQGESLYPHMSVFENLAFPLRMRRVTGDEISERVEAVARQLGVSDLLRRNPETLSGGQSRRVALGRALVRRPGLFLLDEPFSNLDAHLKRQLRDELKRIRRVGAPTTTILVTHDQQEAMLLGDRVAVMSAGVVHQCDVPRRLLEAPRNRFVASFVGDPPMNLIRGAWDSNAGRPVFQSPDITFALSASQAAMLAATNIRSVELGIHAGAIRGEEVGSTTASTDSDRVAFSASLVDSDVVGRQWESRLTLNGGTELVCRSDHALGRVGERRRLYFEIGEAFFFDADEEPAASGIGRNLLLSDGRPVNDGAAATDA